MGPFFNAIRTFPLRRPFIFGVGLAGLKNGGCDVLVQSGTLVVDNENNKNSTLNGINWKRTFNFY